MAKRWYQEHQRDTWRRQARNSGYRARSAFKLKQIQERHNVIRQGDSVLDIGCHPGGWTQVALEEVGESGTVVGIALRPTAPIDGASILTGDVRDEGVGERLSSENLDQGYNCVVSDISPGLTGRYDTDQAISLELSAMALDVAVMLLKPGGSFVTKAFQGTGIEFLVEACKKRFSFVRRFSPTASRNASSEVYIICKNKKPLSEGLISAIEHIHLGLTDAGILVTEEEGDEKPAVGFRRL